MQKPQKRTLIIAAAAIVLITAVIIAVALSMGGPAELAEHTPVLTPVAEATQTISAEATVSAETTAASSASTKTATPPEQQARPTVPAPSTQQPATTPETPATGTTNSGYTGTVTEVKKELTLAERQACYYKLVEAEDRAIAEATEAYPMEVEDADYDAHYEMRFRLTEEYQTAIRKQYEITVEGMNAVLTEGIENNWPLPPLTQ